MLLFTGARIQSPCNRQCPLSYYASKYGHIPYSASNSSIGSGVNSPSPVPSAGAFRFNQTQNTYRSPMSSPPRTKRDVPPRLPSKKQRSQSLTPAQQQQSQIQRIINVSSDKYNSADGIVVLRKGDENQEPNGQMIRSIEDDEKSTSADGIVNGNHSMGGFNSLSRSELSGNPKNKAPVPPRTSSLSRNSSSNSSLMTPNGEEPPPKPLKDRGKDDPVQRVASYHASGSDSGNGSGDSAQSSTTGEEIITQNRCGGVIIKNPRFMQNSLSSVTLKSFADIDPVAAEEAFRCMEIPYIQQISQYDMDNFHTVLLPCSEFRPLDTGTLTTFRMMISENSPRVIATHITRVDIMHILGKLINFLKIFN